MICTLPITHSAYAICTFFRKRYIHTKQTKLNLFEDGMKHVEMTSKVDSINSPKLIIVCGLAS